MPMLWPFDGPEYNPPEDTPMKEILDMIEASVRRIVREELATVVAPAPVSDPVISGPRFDEMVKQAVLDKPWFDEAIRAEAAAATPPTPTWDATTFGEHMVTQLRNNTLVSTVINDIVDSMVDDRLPDMDEYVKDNDLHDEVRNAINDMSFSVSVD